MVVHYVVVERGLVRSGDEGTGAPGVRIVLGATTEERWRWEMEDGRSSAVDARTLVDVELVVYEPAGGLRWAPRESVHLYTSRADPDRAAAVAAIPTLLSLAWQLFDGGGEDPRAFYGLRIP